MNRPLEVSADSYSSALRLLLCMGCVAYLATGVLTLVVGHCFGLLTLPLVTAISTFLMWWMLVPVLPAVILHPLAVNRVRARQTRQIIRTIE